MLNTSILRMSGKAGADMSSAADGVKSPSAPNSLSRSGESLIMEAERSEGILGMRNGFALSDRSERFAQIIG